MIKIKTISKDEIIEALKENELKRHFYFKPPKLDESEPKKGCRCGSGFKEDVL